jgi:hypothetical protein
MKRTYLASTNFTYQEITVAWLPACATSSQCNGTLYDCNGGALPGYSAAGCCRRASRQRNSRYLCAPGLRLLLATTVVEALRRDAGTTSAFAPRSCYHAPSSRPRYSSSGADMAHPSPLPLPPFISPLLVLRLSLVLHMLTTLPSPASPLHRHVLARAAHVKPPPHPSLCPRRVESSSPSTVPAFAGPASRRAWRKDEFRGGRCEWQGSTGAGARSGLGFGIGAIDARPFYRFSMVLLH